MLGFNQSYGALLEVEERIPEPAEFELFLENFTLGLEEEQVVGIIALQHLEKQPRACLKLSLASLLASRELLEDQASDAGDLVELPAGQFGRVQTGDHIFQQVLNR